jgi:hypothetical protein
MKAILNWARAEGREMDVSPELLEIAGSEQLTDEQVNRKLIEMEAARKTRRFGESDAIRAELTQAGITVENTKDGVRWRRKSPYKTSLISLGPVAVRLNQSEVNAPEHDTSGVVTCDICKERFAVGPNRIFGSRSTEEDCIKQLEALLRADHQDGRPHANSYELKG